MTNNKNQKWEIIHIIDKALHHKDDGVKAYARKLADKYRQEGENKFADCILSAIGDKEVPMATMDGKKTPKSDFQQLAEDLMNLNPIEVELLRLTSENDMPPAGVCSMV
jgi:hypothetical protein